ncbi:MAG: helix-turn-helix domain-containing protein [Caulobacterales bacterium]
MARDNAGLDVEIGDRIRGRRLELEVSQKALAAALGVCFQQLQKYERGANRLSASMLVKTAARLETSVAALVGEDGPERIQPIIRAQLGDPGTSELLAVFATIEEREARRALVALAQCFVREQDRQAWLRLGRPAKT